MEARRAVPPGGRRAPACRAGCARFALGGSVRRALEHDGASVRPTRPAPTRPSICPDRNALLVIKAALWCQSHELEELALGVVGHEPLRRRQGPVLRASRSDVELSSGEENSRHASLCRVGINGPSWSWAATCPWSGPSPASRRSTAGTAAFATSAPSGSTPSG